MIPLYFMLMDFQWGQTGFPWSRDVGLHTGIGIGCLCKMFNFWDELTSLLRLCNGHIFHPFTWLIYFNFQAVQQNRPWPRIGGDQFLLMSLFFIQVERGIQTNFEEEAADSIKQEAGEAPIDIAIQTDISPPMCKKDVGQQVSLQAPGQCSATQTSILTRSMLVQTKKQKYRNKDTQTKTTKCCTAEVQAGEPGFALKAPCLPKVNSASQCVRTTMDTRYTQTTSVKKKKSHTVKCQTVLQSSEHLRHRKGEQLGPWISCGQKPKPPSADPFFVMLAVLSIFIQLDWRDVTSKFVTDVPTVLRDDYYTWYTLRAMIESLSYLVYGCFSFFYIIGSLMRPSSRT